MERGKEGDNVFLNYSKFSLSLAGQMETNKINNANLLHHHTGENNDRAGIW